ncbi:MAG: HAD family hydrolase [Rhodospirillales bacterium]
MLIIFDCDGVLVDSEIISNRVLAAHLSRFGYPVTGAESRARFIGRTIPGIIKMVTDAGVTLPDDFEATLREKDIVAFARELRPVNGMQSTLEQLGGFRKCVASSGSPDKIRRNLETTGLLHYFDPFLFSARDVKKPKPAPDIFLLAADRMGFAADRCTVIEDTPLGIEAARRAGMRAFGFIGASHRVPADEKMLLQAGADRVFADMTHLPSLL